jgi:hypothetical protein
MTSGQPKRYMLHTNILIYRVNNNPASIGDHISRLPASAQLCMSFVSYGELLKGAELSRKKRESFATTQSAHAHHQSELLGRCGSLRARRSASIKTQTCRNTYWRK